MKYIKNYNIFESAEDEETLDIFIDGSYFLASPSKIYTSAYMSSDKTGEDYVLSNNFTKSYTENVFKIKIDKLTSAHAELMAMYEILDILNQTKNKNVNIYTDYMILFDMFYMTNRYKKHNMKIISSIIKDLYEKVKQNNQVNIRWIKGHSQVYGNVIANYLAKLHSKFDTITTYLLEIPEERTKQISIKIPEYSFNKII
jgi:ribonuclease HI